MSAPNQKNIVETRRTRFYVGVFYSLVFTLALLYLLFTNLPASLINRALKSHSIRLEQLHGNLASGTFAGIHIKGKSYSLNCRYDYIFPLSYQLDCPRAVLHIKVSWQLLSATFKVQDSQLRGDSASSAGQALLALLGFAPNIAQTVSGQYDWQLTDLQWQNQRLKSLLLTGTIKNLRASQDQVVLLDSERIEVKTLQTQGPIRLQFTGTGRHPFHLETQINDNHYQTEGTISGKDLDKYQSVLRFFGKKTAPDTWQIHLTGVF